MYIKVRVIAGTRAEQIVKKSEDTYAISVREPAERNLANDRICEIISVLYGVQRSAVRIVHGHHSQSKILSIILPE